MFSNLNTSYNNAKTCLRTITIFIAYRSPLTFSFLQMAMPSIFFINLFIMCEDCPKSYILYLGILLKNMILI